MDSDAASAIRELVGRRKTASLGTLHHAGPFVSMVPFAVARDGSAFLIHVSGLAAHTRDMLSDPRVSLMVCEAEESGVMPQALPRLTITGTASPLERGSAVCERASNAYLARFPDSEMMFGLGDFTMFAIVAETVRWVGGFGAATSLTPVALADALLQRH